MTSPLSPDLMGVGECDSASVVSLHHAIRSPLDDDRGLRPIAPGLSLSAQLRMQTAPSHKRVEILLGLPGAIHTQDEYSVWLARFLGLYDPIERSLATFSQWEALGIVPPPHRHTDCLADDLVALGVGPGAAPRAPPAMQPDLPTFAHALGALYVLEGSTLGSRFILRDLETRIGAQIAGATRFLGGRGEAVGPMWQSFKAALDSFGHENADLCADVVTGAKRVFRAILAWFQPLAARTEP